MELDGHIDDRFTGCFELQRHALTLALTTRSRSCAHHNRGPDSDGSDIGSCEPSAVGHHALTRFEKHETLNTCAWIRGPEGLVEASVDVGVQPGNTLPGPEAREGCSPAKHRRPTFRGRRSCRSSQRRARVRGPAREHCQVRQQRPNRVSRCETCRYLVLPKAEREPLPETPTHLHHRRECREREVHTDARHPRRSRWNARPVPQTIRATARGC